MVRASMVIIVFAAGSISCTSQKLPSAEVIELKLHADLVFAQCSVKTYDAMLEENNQRLKRFLEKYEARNRIGSLLGMLDAQLTQVAVSKMQEEARACGEKAVAKAEPFWSAALAAAKDSSETKLLQNYYDTWKSALAAQRPEYQDFLVERAVGTAGAGYFKRADAARVLNEEAWTAIVASTMTQEHFCLNVLSAYSGASGPDSRAIIESTRAYGVSTADLKSIQLKSPRIGMNKCGVMASWGKTKEVQVSTDKAGVREHWKYNGNQQVEFQDGLVKSFSN